MTNTTPRIEEQSPGQNPISNRVLLGVLLPTAALCVAAAIGTSKQFPDIRDHSIEPVPSNHLATGLETACPNLSQDFDECLERTADVLLGYAQHLHQKTDTAVAKLPNTSTHPYGEAREARTALNAGCGDLITRAATLNTLKRCHYAKVKMGHSPVYGGDDGPRGAFLSSIFVETIEFNGTPVSATDMIASHLSNIEEHLAHQQI